MSVTEEVGELKSLQYLEQFLTPIADQLAELRSAQAGIILVVHRPTAFAMKGFGLLGLKPKEGGTTAYGISCADAVRAFGHDRVTARWAGSPPPENCMKILFFFGDGSVLLHRFLLPEGPRLVLTPDFDVIH